MTLTVTPDLKNPAAAKLLLVQIAGTEHARCGGTILAHVYGNPATLYICIYIYIYIYII